MDFVTQEIWEKLKEKGYSPDYRDFGYRPMYSDDGTIKCINTTVAHEQEHLPTIEEVLEWLRKKKKIHIKVPATFSEKYWWEITDFKRELSEYDADLYDYYEQAALSGIRYALDNLV